MPRTAPPRSLALDVTPLPAFAPDLYARAWCSIPHPSLPLLATAHGKQLTVFSLSTLSSHSALTGGHQRSVRAAAWRPGEQGGRLCLASGSFDSTAALWRYQGGGGGGRSGEEEEEVVVEREVTARGRSGKGKRRNPRGDEEDEEQDDDDGEDEDGGDGGDDWSFELVLEGHSSEIKGVAFSPSGQYLATCSRDKSVWIWEDASGFAASGPAFGGGGAAEEEDEWETVAVLEEHEGDVKAVAWCPELPPSAMRNGGDGGRRRAGDLLASASYDNTVRLWREDVDGDWVCVGVLEGHAGTVWSVAWEPVRPGQKRFPRLLTGSADATVRVWARADEADLADDDDDDDTASGEDEGEGGVDKLVHPTTTTTTTAGGAGGFFGSGLVPNTMRLGPGREEWVCVSVLPRAHSRDVYAAGWSSGTTTDGGPRLVASTGSDGVLVVYGEVGADEPGGEEKANEEANEERMAAMELDGEETSGMTGAATAGGDDGKAEGTAPAGKRRTTWKVLATVPNAHGPYEVNHVTWCKRFDAGCDKKGVEEMLVTTGDDGTVRPWKVEVKSS